MENNINKILLLLNQMNFVLEFKETKKSKLFNYKKFITYIYRNGDICINIVKAIRVMGGYLYVIQFGDYENLSVNNENIDILIKILKSKYYKLLRKSKIENLLK